MNKPTLEDIKKAIDKIDAIYLQDLFNHLFDKLTDSGKFPCDDCEGMIEEEITTSFPTKKQQSYEKANS